MLVVKRTFLSFVAFMCTACNQGVERSEKMEIKQAFELCPHGADAMRELFAQAAAFAKRQEAKFVNRGAEAQAGLKSINSKVIGSTGGPLLLLTVERSGEFRISLTNAGLEQKVAMTISFLDARKQDGAVFDFVNKLKEHWTIIPVSGGVLNEPSCQ